MNLSSCRVIQMDINLCILIQLVGMCQFLKKKLVFYLNQKMSFCCKHEKTCRDPFCPKHRCHPPQVQFVPVPQLITGPTGQQGPRGVQGEQGEQGVQGVQGGQGVQGEPGDPLAIQGTPNQIVATAAGDTVILSTPQDIAPTSSPEFATLTLSQGVLLPTTGGTASLLSAYSKFTHNSTWSGPMTPTNGNISIVVIGKLVTLNIPQVLNNGNGVNTFITGSPALPAWIRPAILQRPPAVVVNSNVTEIGSAEVGLDGVIKFYRGGQNVFTATGNVGFRGLSVSYIST